MLFPYVLERRRSRDPYTPYPHYAPEPFAMAVPTQALIDKLNATCNKALQQAVGLSFTRTHFSVEIEHWLLALLGNTNNDLTYILRQYAIDAARVKQQLEKPLGELKRG